LPSTINEAVNAKITTDRKCTSKSNGLKHLHPKKLLNKLVDKFCLEIYTIQYTFCKTRFTAQPKDIAFWNTKFIYSVE